MKYKGTVAVEGIALGKLFLYEPYCPCISDEIIAPEIIGEELQKFSAAKEAAEGEIKALIMHFGAENNDQAKIFQAHLDIIEDECMNDEIIELIESGQNVAQAISHIYTQYAEIIGSSKDALIAERASDMMDVQLRLLRCVEGKKDNSLDQIQEPVIIVAHDLMPSDTASLNPQNVLALITEIGGTASHSAIIARNYGIPSIVGVNNICTSLGAAETVIVDAENGDVIVSPDEFEISVYKEKYKQFKVKQEITNQYLTAVPKTPSGKRISVLANIGTVNKSDLSCAPYVDGVGLFRTEFIYTGREHPPTEEEQFNLYKSVFETFAPNPVTIRTLDVGGDKEVACLNLPKEMNPFLGNRALRFCLCQKDVFLTQLRAILRASVYGNVKLMFPMVGGIEDVYSAKSMLETAERQLDSEGIPWNHDIKVGTMIEIPALAVISDLLAKEVDFASIGTNDLTQYTLAADRVNPSVSEYYRPFSPAMMRLLNYTISEFNKAGKPISVCGEMAGNPLAAVALIGMGLTQLSMSASAVAYIKKIICTLDVKKAEECAMQICNSGTSMQVEQKLKSLTLM